MELAFKKFKEIENLPTLFEKQKLWLEDYDGITYSKAVNKKHFVKWATQPEFYDKTKFTSEINCIGRKKNRLVIEFDGDGEKAKADFEITKEKLKEMGVGFIHSSHGSQKSDYLWVEFTRDLTTKEAKDFLCWISPDGSEVDLNFTSDKKVYPVLFALHWKYSQVREMPVEYFEGKQLDFDGLGIKKQKIISKTVIGEDGFEYKTYVKNNFKNPMSILTDKRTQAKMLNEVLPYFYDRAGLWWLWNSSEFMWEFVDEVDILNMISSSTGEDVLKPSNRTLILNTLKQEGRKNIPDPAKKTWIQFRNLIFDIETGEQFIATPKYFVTNPIPHELEQEVFDTPNMDRIFEEWVGKDNVETLYEILAYALLPDYPIHRIFCFIGEGMNGKSKFLELLRRFIGTKNCCSTELDTLIQSRFEVTRLHKKLVCQMGETNFNEMSKTSLLKKLSGGDLIGYEYKNKNPFEEKNYAKIIIATNNLPSTTDKTLGFYRRWMIIDFPNRFTEAKDILKDIPDEEYKSLALRCCVTLQSLVKKREFTNEGTIEERTAKYEAKSNFLEKFVSDFTEQDSSGYITKADFYKKFIAWCKENRHREMAENSVGKAMKKLGIETHKKYFDWVFDGKGGQLWCWGGLKWRD